MKNTITTTTTTHDWLPLSLALLPALSPPQTLRALHALLSLLIPASPAVPSPLPPSLAPSLLDAALFLPPAAAATLSLLTLSLPRWGPAAAPLLLPPLSRALTAFPAGTHLSLLTDTLKLLRQLRSLDDETPSLSLLRQLRRLFYQLRDLPAGTHAPATSSALPPSPAPPRGNHSITVLFAPENTPAECVCTWNDARPRNSVPSFHFARTGFLCRCPRCVGANEDPRESLLALLQVVAAFGGNEWLAGGDVVARVVSYEELERLRDQLCQRGDDAPSTMSRPVSIRANSTVNSEKKDLTKQLLDVIATLMQVLARTAPPSQHVYTGRMKLLDAPQKASPPTEREQRSSLNLDAVVSKVLPLFSKPMSHPWNNRIAIQIESVSL
ncbi:hypothetical protein WA588_005168 [Blastocystis sp. NMH]